jgi:putative addiction module antidote
MSRHKKIESAAGQIVGTVELKKIGNSTGVIFPKELMSRLNLSAGDSFYATLTPDGGVRFTPYDPKFAAAMKIARRGMKVYRNALAALAK